MFKKFLAIVAMLYAAASFAAVDVNKATAADLDSVKGIGPAISTKIVDERKKGTFKDWQDFIDRVKGVGEGNAAKFSAEGLTVNGAAFAGAPAATTKTAAKDAKATAKDEKKAAKETAKEEKKAAKDAAKAETKAAEVKKDAKVDKAEAKKDAKEADAKAKEAAAKDAKPVAPAVAVKPAASAAAAKPAASAASARK